MKYLTEHLVIHTRQRREFINLTPQVEALVGARVRLCGVCVTRYDWLLRINQVELHLLDAGENPEPDLLRLEQAIARLYGLSLETPDV